MLVGACTGGHGQDAASSAAAKSRLLQLREVLSSSIGDGSAMAGRPFTTGVIKRDDPYRQTPGFAEAAPDAAGDVVTFEDGNGDGLYTPATDPKLLLGPVRISGRDVRVATATLVPTPGGPARWQVEFILDEEGTKTFHDLTSRLVGKQLAIVVNGLVLSAPTVQTPITQGRGIIGGRLTERQAKALAADLSAAR